MTPTLLIVMTKSRYVDSHSHMKMLHHTKERNSFMSFEHIVEVDPADFYEPVGPIDGDRVDGPYVDGEGVIIDDDDRRPSDQFGSRGEY